MGRKPTHDLCMIQRDGKKGGFQTIGAGWTTEKGDISIKLNRGVIISWRDMDDHALYIFKKTDRQGDRAHGSDQAD